MLKIISGEYRSRRLLSPRDDEVTRPCLARVRESVFSMLHACCEDASVLDLFAGVGTIGLEAVSRGAAFTLMVEQDRGVHALLQQNIDALGCGDRAVAMLGDALGSACLHRARQPVDLLFVDPPYRLMRQEAGRSRVLGQIARAASIMSATGFAVLRSPVGPDDADLVIDGWMGPEPHRYGAGMWVLLYQPAPPADSDAGPAAAEVPTE